MEEGEATEEPVVPPSERPSRPRRLRWGWIVAGGVVIVAAALAVKVPTSNGPTGASDGSRPAAYFQLSRLDDPNRSVSLTDFRGRPVVLNFWASWCVPCRNEMPGFQAVASELAGRVEFLGVNEQDFRPGALDFVAKTGVQYPSVVDSDGILMTAYGLRGLPNTVFISPAGKVLELHAGELNATDLRETIRRLFKV